MDTNLIKPALSVVMPAYNAEDYLDAAIKSVLEQSFRDFELIIINDGSSDKTPDILSHIQDERVKIIDQENHGLVHSLNRAIAEAQAAIIARHDADDRSLAHRFAEQIAFLREHPEVVILGSSMGVMAMDGKYLHTCHVFLNDAELKQELLVRSPFAHGSVMFRKDAFEKAGAYRQKEWPAEDYGLWARMAPFGAFANLNEPLYIYRENTAGISASNGIKQVLQTTRIRRQTWKMRRQLIPKGIDIETYKGLDIAESRTERIARNMLYTLKQALRRVDVLTVTLTLLPLIRNATILRKCARLVMIKVRMRHA